MVYGYDRVSMPGDQACEYVQELSRLVQQMNISPQDRQELDYAISVLSMFFCNS